MIPAVCILAITNENMSKGQPQVRKPPQRDSAIESAMGEGFGYADEPREGSSMI